MKLYNDTFYKNSVEMYNGEYFDSQMLIGISLSVSNTKGYAGSSIPFFTPASPGIIRSFVGIYVLHYYA